MVTATMSLSDDMINLFADELGAEVRLVDPGAEQEEEMLKVLNINVDDDEDDEGAVERPPIITVMGHVDHGKTLLLDRIRKANVVASEAGGITQHIGAYQAVRNDRPLTFIDTPGHEAFTAMRARGAQATDIVILVVAADDGVMPQTLEALDHARAAEVPIVVAINKMDREGADANRVLAQLAERNLIPESYGGDVITVPVSAMTEMGIDDLLDQLLVVAELEELTANPDGRAQGTVLESNLDKGRGPVATILVQKGTLRVGDPLVAGAAWGRVRAMIDDKGQQIKEAGPSTPVQVLGLSEVARAGDMFAVAPDEKSASKVAETREHWQRQASMANTAAVATGGAKLEDLFKQIQAGEAATLNLILKADVHGSLEAVTDSLRKLERDDVKLAFVSRGVGGITENDVQLAMASNATMIGFNVRPDRKARELAESEGVEIRLYEIIYKLLEDVQNAMLGLLEPEFEEIVTGEANVRQVFRISGVGPVAGCFVEHGTLTRGSKVRFLREGTIIWKGAIESLKHFQDDAKEVRAGMECGIGLTDFTDLKEGDVIETYNEKEIPIS
jgi:translation initiation factor IF-2